MNKKIFFASSLLCIGLATCQFHFENDNLDLTVKGECQYENAQKNAPEKGQEDFFKNCSKDAEEKY